MNRSGDMAPTDLPLENAISADFEGSPLSLVAGEITGEELQQDGVYGSPSAAVNFSFDSHDSEQMHSGNNSSLEMNSSWTSSKF